MRTHPDVLNRCSTWRVECQWCSTMLRGVEGGGSFKWTCREPCFHTTGVELPPSRLIIPIHTSNCLAGKTVPAIVDGVVRTREVGHYSWRSAKGLRGVRGGGDRILCGIFVRIGHRSRVCPLYRGCDIDQKQRPTPSPPHHRPHGEDRYPWKNTPDDLRSAECRCFRVKHK